VVQVPPPVSRLPPRRAERRDPDVVVELNRRAAAWCEANGAPEEAVTHAHAAGDFDCLARLVGKLALPMCATGRTAIVEEWLGWFDDERLERYPAVAVLGAWVHLLRGRGAAAKQWLSVGERSSFDGDLPDGSRSLEPWIAVVRAAICRDGVERMRIDAELAVRDLGAASGWRPAANLLLGVAQVLLDEDEQGDESLADAAEAAESAGATTTRIVALAERSLLSAARGNDAGAEALAVQARALIDEGQVGDDLLSAIAFAASVRQGLRRGNLVEARADLRQAYTLTPQLTHSIPWYSVQTHLELGRAELALLNTPGARARLSAAAEILSRRPQLGALNAQSDALHAEAAKFAGVCKDRSTTLTKAELRLLPFLTTHLSMPEIAEHLFVSRNTVKSQAITLYRKLDASSRSAAIAKAIELGLIDAPTPPRPTRLAVPG
jgi:LuxR family maltose regulon positive regulatory protein